MKHISVITLCLLSSMAAMSQQANPDNFAKMVDFLPPPPNAAAIAKAGLMNLNKNTGAPSVSIPLYSIKGRKLATEVSLSYSTNGIKVDEIASRVGMGWAINSGGVITRTVRGLSDEDHVRTWPWAPVASNWGTYNFMRRIAAPLAAPNGQEYDGEPDLFNFNVNGISGSFVFDGQMNVVLVPHNNVMIQYNFGGTAWNFKITGPDGIRYYFGGTGATEKTKRLTTCGKSFGYYIPTAWYLTKIEHPNGEVITFNYLPLVYSYDTGISETRTYTNGVWGSPDQGCGGALNAPQNTGNTWYETTCKNYVNTQGVILDNIVTDNYAKIKFNYIARPEGSDKLISSIVETDLNTNAVIESYNLNYTNVTTSTYNNYQGEGFVVPYLTSLTENSGDNTLSKTHYFSYDDPAARPCRLSYAQDHWGFFNGKNNGTLVPRVDYLADRFPLVTASREPDFNFTAKGMLKKIVYPTGGIQTLEYEPNIIRVEQSYSPLHQHTCSVSSTGVSTLTAKEINFSTTQTSVMLNISMSVNCNDPYNCDDSHLRGVLTLLDATGNTIVSYTKVPGSGFSNLQWAVTTPGSYKLLLQAFGNVTTGVTMNYHPDNLFPGSTIDKVAGGLRVKSIITGNPNEKPMVKRYYYGDINSLDISTLSPVPDPVYVKEYQTWAMVPTTNPAGVCTFFRNDISLYSNSITNLFNYSNSLTCYGSVVEGIGDNFEGGATQSKFISQPDINATTVLGRVMFDAPKINTSLALNGKPTEETVYKNVNGALIPVAKKSYTYVTPLVKEVPGYVVNQFKPFEQWALDTTQYNPLLPGMVAGFDLSQYSVIAPWTVNQTLTETQYDENGQNPLTKVTTNHYNNSVHQQLTSSETTNSKGETVTNNFKYSWDLEGMDPGADALIMQHNIIAPMESKVSNGTSEMEKLVNHYTDFGNNNVEVSSIDKSVKGNALENLGTITKRDNYGNILEFTGKDGVTNSIIWGYKYSFPIAKVANAGYDAAVAQLSVTMASLQNLDGTALQTELNRIRTGIPTAQVTSYTYNPLVGVTSITDPNNKTNSFQYDAFNRLVVVKDQDNNVVKKMEYQYNGGNPASTFTIYYNDPQTGGFACQHCAAGYISNSVAYTIPAGMFYSLNSVTEANQKALTYLNATGPAYAEEYAKSNALCYNTACAAQGQSCNSNNCNGVEKKCINNVCEIGQKIYTSSIYNRITHLWTCTYHYHWSDGSNSPDYTETSNNSCNLEP